MYKAKENKIYYIDLHENEFLFITVHPTPTNKSKSEQASILAQILNKL